MRRWAIAIMLLVATAAFSHGWPDGGGGTTTVTGTGGDWTRTGTVISPVVAGDDVGNDATQTNWAINDNGSAIFESYVLAGPNTNPADTGELRFDNNSAICWESSPAGADNCMYVDSNETLQLPMVAPPRSAAGPATCGAAYAGTIYYDTTLKMMCVCSDRSTAFIWESFDNTVEGSNADCG